MGSMLGGFVLPLLLLTAGLMNWSLISLINLVTSLLLRFNAPKRGFRLRGRVLSLWFVFIYSAFVILLQVIFLTLSATRDSQWSIADAWWIKLLGLMKLASCLSLPAVQLVSGISNPSWLSLPFFICSCVGLVDWSITSNFLGLFRWWKLLWVYAGFSICLLYVYQLPVGFPQMFQSTFDSIGLYKVSVNSDWQQICSGTSLMVFYYMYELEDMEFIMSMREGSLTEQLLPSRNSFFVRQLRLMLLF
ncbi:hypothetical protein CDL12_19746 [Handroanthus impetiginosus]|uniref:Piezo non-specific cation channel R-Ras-binding domain-containing protein n=1 Tax=Handroanthus impetiginosus TaxID=429701 RepID=A0A2G9GQY6_9LAMI|nr:hypothetical protein CDL12_19746 [Handroanthus impetiginosus]